MKVIRSISDLNEWRRSLSPEERVGFFPTMGALHEGHLQGVRQGARDCTQMVVSIYVNPAQFGPKEDFKKYPRTLEEDLEKLRTSQVQAVFCPSDEDVYPPNYSTWIEESKYSQGLCGDFRPGHFRGVASIVYRLLNWVKPHHAYFGLKDAQQFLVIAQMVRDLSLPVEIVPVATSREPDGLAMSSRNRYLSEAERRAAPLLYQTLKDAAEKWKTGKGWGTIETHARTMLEGAGFKPQYFTCMDRVPWEKAAESDVCKLNNSYLIAAAAWMGVTRLIDNVIL